MGEDLLKERAAGLGRSVALGVALGVGMLVAIGAAWFWWETEGAWSQYPIVGIEDATGEDVRFSLWVGCIDGEIRASSSEDASRALVSVEVRGERS